MAPGKTPPAWEETPLELPHHPEICTQAFIPSRMKTKTKTPFGWKTTPSRKHQQPTWPMFSLKGNFSPDASPSPPPGRPASRILLASQVGVANVQLRWRKSDRRQQLSNFTDTFRSKIPRLCRTRPRVWAQLKGALNSTTPLRRYKPSNDSVSFVFFRLQAPHTRKKSGEGMGEKKEMAQAGRGHSGKEKKQKKRENRGYINRSSTIMECSLRQQSNKIPLSVSPRKRSKIVKNNRKITQKPSRPSSECIKTLKIHSAYLRYTHLLHTFIDINVDFDRVFKQNKCLQCEQGRRLHNLA